jgi:hypothetical protein
MMTVLPPMNDPDKVDLLVSAHLQKTLESQRGRAVASFREKVKSGAASPASDDSMSFEAEARRRSMRMLRIWATTASALAACLALVVTLELVQRSSGGNSQKTPIGLTVTPASASVMDQVELSREVDGGTSELDDQTPVRIVREQRLKQMQWFDPNEKATYSVTEPVEKVGYVRLQPN